MEFCIYKMRTKTHYEIEDLESEIEVLRKEVLKKRRILEQAELITKAKDVGKSEEHIKLAIDDATLSNKTLVEKILRNEHAMTDETFKSFVQYLEI